MIPFADGAPSAPGLISPTQVPFSELQSMAASPRVLVTEDDDAVRGVILRVLGDHGYEVFEARNMQEAIERFRECAPIHLLLTDFFMPGGTGRELADVLWAQNPELPVICMSGYEQETPDAVGSPLVVHLPKPFKTTNLLSQVAHLLRAAQQPLPPGAA